MPLVDELLVVDSDSTDATAAVARAAGADVVATAEVLPAHGSRPGKGEALWKSLAATTGDLVVFLDADLLGDVVHYVPGLLGPLLTDPQVDYVKGCYTRPLELDGESSRPAADGSPSSPPGRCSTRCGRSSPGSSSRWAASTPGGARCWSRCRSSPATAWRSGC